MQAVRDIRDDPQFQALVALSARIGAEPVLVQAAGGNTSLKRDGVLWIKASGTWLQHAAERDIMVPVALAPLIDSIYAGDRAADRAETFVVAEANPAGLRPSIETSMHAIMPHDVVLHVHCVETIAWACLPGAEALLTPLLHGLRWAWVPYVRPGLPLALAIGAGGLQAHVLVLGNHGLVVAAEDVMSAEALLRDVIGRLRRPPRTAPSPDLAMLWHTSRGTAYRLPKHVEAHATATDVVSSRIAARGSLYPDHVVFLGPGAALIPEGEDFGPLVRSRSLEAHPPLILLLGGAGVLLHQSVMAGADEMARCLADVTARIGSGDDPIVLTPLQERELVDWDAEKYRKAVSAAGLR